MLGECHRWEIKRGVDMMLITGCWLGIRRVWHVINSPVPGTLSLLSQVSHMYSSTALPSDHESVWSLIRLH